MFKKASKIIVVSLLTLISSSVFAAQLVDINKADAVTIAENLNGIGDAKAKAIVAYRLVHGDFKNADDLINVKGIGTKLVDRNKDLISYAKASATPATAPKLADSASTDKPIVLPTTGKDATPPLKQPASN